MKNFLPVISVYVFFIFLVLIYLYIYLSLTFLKILWRYCVVILALLILCIKTLNK